ncbi:MAG: TolC family protein, partial [Gammaproteobacteria bacterium]
SSLWSMPIPDFTSARADLFQLEALQPFPAYANLLERNPDLVRLATRQRLASARLQLAQSARRPDIQLSGGMRYFAESDDMAFVLSATIPLGTAERAVSSIREEELLGQIDPLEYEQKKLTLHATLFEIYQEIKHSRFAVETLQQRIIPSAQQALNSYEKLYYTGRYSLLELLESQRSLLQARFQLIEAAARFHRLRIDLERLTGASILTGDHS